MITEIVILQLLMKIKKGKVFFYKQSYSHSKVTLHPFSYTLEYIFYIHLNLFLYVQSNQFISLSKNRFQIYSLESLIDGRQRNNDFFLLFNLVTKLCLKNSPGKTSFLQIKRSLSMLLTYSIITPTAMMSYVSVSAVLQQQTRILLVLIKLFFDKNLQSYLPFLFTILIGTKSQRDIIISLRRQLIIFFSIKSDARAWLISTCRYTTIMVLFPSEKLYCSG